MWETHVLFLQQKKKKKKKNPIRNRHCTSYLSWSDFAFKFSGEWGDPGLTLGPIFGALIKVRTFVDSTHNSVMYIVESFP